MRHKLCKSTFYSKAILCLYCLASTFVACRLVDAQQTDKPLALYIPASYDPRLSQWLTDYLQTVNEETSLEEVIDAILEYRAALMLQGYIMPQVSDLMPYFQANLKERGIELPDEQFEFLRGEFVKRERRSSKQVEDTGADFCRHHRRNQGEKKEKKKEKWEFSFTRKSIFGLIKFCGGAITFIIPHPAAQGVGIVLMGDGIKDILDEACEGRRDPADENKKTQKALEAGGAP